MTRTAMNGEIKCYLKKGVLFRGKITLVSIKNSFKIAFILNLNSIRWKSLLKGITMRKKIWMVKKIFEALNAR